MEGGFSGWSDCKAKLDEHLLAARKRTDERAKPSPRWRLHDLRRTVVTLMVDKLGVLPHIVEAILNHISGHRAGVVGVYNRARCEAEMRATLERWADHVAASTPP
jgi:integrase